MKTVSIIIGTRPEAVKMAPVYQALASKKNLQIKLISTGQHQELLSQALSAFDLTPHYDLKVMQPGQSLSELTARLLLGLEQLFQKDRPDLILAHGDTTTCYASALSAFYHAIPFFHVEAGLRTFRLDSPFPEEFYRQCVTRMATHHFAPTEQAKQNLLKEGIPDLAISVIGNTAFDAVQFIHHRGLSLDHRLQKRMVHFRKTALVTLHRREGGSRALQKILIALKRSVVQHLDTLFVFPVHPSPQVKHLAHTLLASEPNVLLLEPMDYPHFLSLLNASSLVLTDSGGVQEEAAYFGKPTLVLRDITERPDGLGQQKTVVIGTDPARIMQCISEELAKTNANPPIAPSAQQSPSQLVANVIEEKCVA